MMSDEWKMNELSDDELDTIAGGKLEFKMPEGKKNPSDVVFRFNVGDHVEVLCCNIIFYGSVTDRSVIVSREAKLDNGLYYPYYKTKRLDDLDSEEENGNFENRLSY